MNTLNYKKKIFITQIIIFFMNTLNYIFNSLKKLMVFLQ